MLDFKDLRKGPYLDRGGQGEVFEVVGRPGHLLKFFAKEPDTARLAQLYGLVAAGTPALHRVAAWPLRVARVEDRAAIVMRRVRNAYPLHEMYDVGNLRQKPGFEHLTWATIVGIACSLADACTVVHQAGFLIADLSEKNVLVEGTRSPGVRMIDCDSFVRAGECSPLGTPLCLAPELIQRRDEIPRTADHDNYSLARLIFLLLSLGSEPMMSPAGSDSNDVVERVFAFSRFRVVREPLPNEVTLDHMPNVVASLFERAFAPRGAGAPPRPAADEWWRALRRMESRLQRCPANRNHMFTRGKACAWCAMARLGQADPFPSRTRPAAPPMAPEPVTPRPASAVPPPKPRRWLFGLTVAGLAAVGLVIFAGQRPAPPMPPVPPSQSGAASQSAGQRPVPPPSQSGAASQSAGQRPVPPPSQSGAASQSAGQRPVPPPSNVEARVRGFILATIGSYNRNNQQALEQFDAAYAELVYFYNQHLKRVGVLRQQYENILSRWPERYFRPRPSTLQVTCNKTLTCTAGVTVEFSVWDGVTHYQGVRHYDFVIDAVGVSPRITEEDGYAE